MRKYKKKKVHGRILTSIAICRIDFIVFFPVFFVLTEIIFIFADRKRIDRWCNGSTTVFGAVCLGSNPSRSTIVKQKPLYVSNIQGFFIAPKRQSSYYKTNCLWLLFLPPILDVLFLWQPSKEKVPKRKISASDASAKFYGIFNPRRPSRTAPRARIVSICLRLCSRPAC